jgi:inner membrane protein involved in colicin E2 resistance
MTNIGPINIEGATYLSSAALSVVLFMLSLTAYSKTENKKLAYAAAAFGIFSIYLFSEFLEELFSESYVHFMLPVLVLLALILFFRGIAVK